MKPGKKPIDINPDELKVGVKVNVSKIQDVQALLGKHYGEKWNEIENVKWYEEVISNNDLMPDNPQPECECLNETSNEGHEIEVNQLVLLDS